MQFMLFYIITVWPSAFHCTLNTHYRIVSYRMLYALLSCSFITL